MKKKVLMAILPVCVAVAMTACGGNADTAEVKETAVTEESTEADVQEEAESEAPTANEEAAEPEQTEEGISAEEESLKENETGSDENQFPAVEEGVAELDRSAETGVNSISCFDLDEFLDENGELIDDWVWDSGEEDPFGYYTGRWAYPEMTPCELFTNLTMTKKTDRTVSYKSTIGDTDVELYTNVTSGLGEYHHTAEFAAEYAGDGVTDDSGVPYSMFTAQTPEGETEVYVYPNHYGLSDGDEDNSQWYWQYYYYFNIGNFSVMVVPEEVPDTEEPNKLAEEDVQLIIDNIRLTGGAEH